MDGRDEKDGRELVREEMESRGEHRLGFTPQGVRRTQRGKVEVCRAGSLSFGM